MNSFRRVALVVMDSVGIGEMPDAAEWGDAGSDTLGHVLETQRPQLPNLREMGLGNIRSLPHLPPVEKPAAAFGKAATASRGKDTTVGHWEIAGLYIAVAFPTYPDGFPARILDPFRRAIGRDVLGNRPASGTEIIRELGLEHTRTAKPIVYTSADSVFQIAAHEEVVPLEELYRMCREARQILSGADQVARVIARPFAGPPGEFRRTANRKDFAIPPPEPTLLDRMADAGLAVIGVGKIASIFDHRGITENRAAHNNGEVVDQTIAALRAPAQGLVFSNLVDFDMLWGHRNDAPGYARGLEEFDRRLPELRSALGEDDLLILCADHGCDPTTASTDHSREYVPLLAWSPRLEGGAELGTRRTMADIARTVGRNFGIDIPFGTSFLDELR